MPALLRNGTHIRSGKRRDKSDRQLLESELRQLSRSIKQDPRRFNSERVSINYVYMSRVRLAKIDGQTLYHLGSKLVIRISDNTQKRPKVVRLRKLSNATIEQLLESIGDLLHPLSF